MQPTQHSLSTAGVIVLDPTVLRRDRFKLLSAERLEEEAPLVAEHLRRDQRQSGDLGQLNPHTGTVALGADPCAGQRERSLGCLTRWRLHP